MECGRKCGAEQMLAEILIHVFTPADRRLASFIRDGGYINPAVRAEVAQML